MTCFTARSEDRARLHGDEGDDNSVRRRERFRRRRRQADRFVLDDPGTGGVPTIGDHNGAEDRIELRYEDDGSGTQPVLSLDHDTEGAAVIRMDGVAVGRLMNAQGAGSGETSMLTPVQPAA